MQFASEQSIVRPLKQLAFALVAVISVQTGSAFSLLGPVNEAYQQPVIGYNIGDDVGAPKNLGEEYRYNTPVLYYAFDQNFIEYFGTTGMAAVESAIEMLNSLTNAGFSGLNPSEFPLDSIRINPRAEQLVLLDLKTATAMVMLEELGLADPIRWVWTLRDRRPQAPLNCPWMYYFVIMRNFDPLTYNPSPYINGVLYSYTIFEKCTGENPLAVTDNFPVDPLAPPNTPLASTYTLRDGAFALSLTQDDIGGLRYLYGTNNVNWETAPAGSEMFYTNTSQAQLVFSSNLWGFAQAALTNTAVGLETLYPGLLVTSTTNIFTNVWVTNITAYFTNIGPWTPVGAPPVLRFATNLVLTIQTHYIHTFGNAFRVVETPGGTRLEPLGALPKETDRMRVRLETVAITNAPWAPIYGGTNNTGSNAVANFQLVTNHTLKTVYRPGYAGDFVILPTNACSLDILGLQATLVTWVTNSLVSTTNVFGTNAVAITNDVRLPQYTQNLINVESNRVWVAYPVECNTTNSSSLFRGIDRIQFVRTSYDSLLGRFYRPITNYYPLTEVTNSMERTRTVRRIVTQPDFLFSSFDVAEFVLRRTVPRYTTNGVLTDLAGPGVIDPTVEITYNRVGPLLINFYETNTVEVGLGQALAYTNFIWGSFDGTTNEPVIYPQGTTVQDIEQILLFQILTYELPDASVGVPYTQQIEVAGGQAPYIWTPHVDSAPMPAGLALTATGAISGIPAEAGTYTFSVTVTEAGGRSTTRTLTLNINP